MKKAFKIILVPLVFLTLPARAAQPDTCKAGMFITSIYDINIPDKSFTANFWFWMLCRNDSLKLIRNLEYSHTKRYEVLNKYKTYKDGYNWVQVKCRNVMRANWDVRDYPFDRQRLHFEIASAEYDAGKLVFVADTQNSEIDPLFRLDGWNIDGFKIGTAIEKEKSTYGDPAVATGSKYSYIYADIEISRSHSWLILFKMLTGLFVAFLVASCCFLVNIQQTSPRFSICVGSLWAAVASKYIVDSKVPSAQSLTLIDTVHNFTFIMILLAIILSAVYLKLAEKDSGRLRLLVKKADRITYFVYILIYAVVVSVMVLNARFA